jgi:DNA-directed RNA polymerase subunit M/transcription elongation factor TFIIS
MKIKEILWQSRRDFEAIYECEHCGNTVKEGGYDDSNFHNNVIPMMVCKKCGKKADEKYRPLSTKYPEGFQI